MKKIQITILALAFSTYAIAQIEPKTSQGTTDTIAAPINTSAADKTKIANKSILKRNTLDAGMGKPDPIKKDIKTNEPVPPPTPTTKSRVEAVTDTITRKSKE